MSDSEANTNEPSRSKDRSPNFPALTWMMAVAGARKIWESEKKHPLSQELAAKHLGYKGLSGASLPAIAALKQYGLLVADSASDVRISDEAHTMFLYPAESEES